MVKTNNKVKEILKLIKKLIAKRSHEKIIVFTQFKTTLFLLQDTLSSYKTVVFHGSMSREEKDEAIASFQKEKQILISTEAGGEGRNLQFCRILINYDLPWNPFKLEQRIGRIHRFGQKYNVDIFNFTMKESIGEKFLKY